MRCGPAGPGIPSQPARWRQQLARYRGPVIRKYFECDRPERVRRALVLVMIVGVAYVPGSVALAMLLTGAD